METETNLYLNAPVSALPLFELEEISPSDENPPVPSYAWKNVNRHRDSPVLPSNVIGNVRAQNVSPRVASENSETVESRSFFQLSLFSCFPKRKNFEIR